MAAFTALALAGAAVSAYGQVKAGLAAKSAGQAQQAAANDQADVADYNATVAEQQANDAITRGQIDEDRYRQGVKAMVGTQRTTFAAGNVDVSGGSAVDVQAETAHQGELDALTIRNNATLTAFGYKVQAYDLRRSATIARKTGVYQAEAGETRAEASYIGAAGSILGTATSLAAAKYGFGAKG